MKQNKIMYRIELHVPQPCTSRLLIASSILRNCIVIFWHILGIFWILDQSRVVMPRLKYYNYFAHINKYDCGLSINHWEQYNDDINNPSNQANPSSSIYNFNINSIDFNITSLHDRLLLSVDEQIFLHLTPQEVARSKTNYENNLQRHFYNNEKAVEDGPSTYL